MPSDTSATMVTLSWWIRLRGSGYCILGWSMKVRVQNDKRPTSTQANYQRDCTIRHLQGLNPWSLIYESIE